MTNSRSRRLLPALATLAIATSPVALVASNPSPSSMPQPPAAAAKTPEQEADALYTDGVSYREKADKLEKEAAAEPDAKKKAKLESKAADKHKDSIEKFQKATSKNPAHYSAWGSLGYAYRKTGNYPASLEAYQKALDLQPTYTPAIEYRAEAYLAMGRLDEVKSAYMSLFTTDRPRANELAAAIDSWLEKKKADPSGVDPAKLEDFSQWAAQRKQIASQVSDLGGPARRW
jgi:tetratricopeptide (TPR) repeat protein